MFRKLTNTKTLGNIIKKIATKLARHVKIRTAWSIGNWNFLSPLTLIRLELFPNFLSLIWGNLLPQSAKGEDGATWHWNYVIISKQPPSWIRHFKAQEIVRNWLKSKTNQQRNAKTFKTKNRHKNVQFFHYKSKFKKHACQNVFAMKTSSPEQRHVKPNWCWIKLRRSNGIWWFFHKNISNGYKFLKSARTLSKPPAPPPPS